MHLDRPTWMFTTMLVLVGIGLASSTMALRHDLAVYHSARRGGDPVSLAGERLQAVRADLPRYGAIGYITDPLPAGDSRAWAEQAREFVITQYQLAPVLVLNWPHLRLVLGNFHQPLERDRIAKLHLAIVKDYGNGLILFRRTAP